MAIDTRNKRSSAVSPQCPWRGMWPAPDSTIEQADRQHALWSYAGIAAATIEAPSEGIDFSLGPLQLEFSLPTLHEFSAPNEQPEFSL